MCVVASWIKKRSSNEKTVEIARTANTTRNVQTNKNTLAYSGNTSRVCLKKESTPYKFGSKIGLLKFVWLIEFISVRYWFYLEHHASGVRVWLLTCTQMGPTHYVVKQSQHENGWKNDSNRFTMESVYIFFVFNRQVCSSPLISHNWIFRCNYRHEHPKREWMEPWLAECMCVLIRE